ncbi:LysR family transcriptional regulator [Marinobacter nanhaiticus D15-8W]|uniref:LysR family transcriptional regulator n=1 Tax=Marinobacter nanhaiticus D15-8W TaxID=626887 RepID=N6W448_9GAMM|nr:LysR family transcriptional regulator [Marinobacter nanhaiticus]ENO14929.1 LysR family transcriptional regulator [Marinobacter nanhaiticus D15-8W]BES69375.1 LysR family transcriptional regulator [Marinobacter nanhaiticus D15-8W]
MSQDIPPLAALRAFEATARLGSVTAAARELHVTHGAVSRQLRSLDEHFGVMLFTKAGRGIQLTHQGERLQQGIGEAFARMRESCAELKRSSEDAPLTLKCPGSLLARWFIPRLDRFQRDLPDVALQVGSGDSELDPRGEEAGATLVFSEPPWPAELDVIELAAEDICAVASPKQAARFDSGHPETIFTAPLLHTHSRPQAWPQWAQAHGLETSRLERALSDGQGFDHLYYLIEAALAGLGVAIAPRLLVQDDLDSGHLVAPWGSVETPGRLCLMLPRYVPSRRGAQLADWLKAEIGSTEGMQ